MKSLKELLSEKILSESNTSVVEKNSYVVIHTTYEYTKPTVTILNASQHVDYFTEDMGFEDFQIKEIKQLKSGDTWKFNGLVVVKA